MIGKRKVVIVGAGHVGSHVAMALCFQGSCDEIVLIDRDAEKARSQSMDVADACLFLPATVQVRAGSYEDCGDADIVVNAVGMPRKPGQTRLDLLDDSVRMSADVAEHLKASGFGGILISITNPADIIGAYLLRKLNLPRERCFSTGTSLDTARLRRTVSELAGIDRKSVQACVLGEHGNSSVVSFATMRLGGLDWREMAERFPGEAPLLREETVLERTREIGNEIISGKGSTEFGIGAACADIIRVIFHDEKRAVPLSVWLDGEYGVHGLACGVPCVLGRSGIERILELPMSEKEKEAFAHSCETIRSYLERAAQIG